MATYVSEYVACGLYRVNCDRINVMNLAVFFRGYSLIFLYDFRVSPLVVLLNNLYCGADNFI